MRATAQVGFVIPEALYNEGLRLLNISPYLASLALRYTTYCPALMLGGYLVKAVPDINICKLKVHRTFFVELHAEPIEIEPFADVGTTLYNISLEWSAIFFN